MKQGQVLAELDCSDYRNAFESAAGQATAAEATALQAKNGVRAQELEQARIDFERAQDEYQRNKYLYDHQSLPANDFHKIESGLRRFASSATTWPRKARESRRSKPRRGRRTRRVGQLSEAKKHLGDCQLQSAHQRIRRNAARQCRRYRDRRQSGLSPYLIWIR